MNYMKEVAHLLGVELDEEFGIKGTTDRYKFNISDGLLYFNDYDNEWYCSEKLYSLLLGESEIIKKPFKPKEDEKYWFIFNGIAQHVHFENDEEDYKNWKLGNCFRTKEEAETKGKELMESIKKEYENA